MNSDLQEAIKNYNLTLGTDVTKEDLERVTEFVIHTLHRETDLTLRQAIKVVSMIKTGSWNEGWDTGYTRGKGK